MSPPSHPCGVQATDLDDLTVLRFTGPRAVLDEQTTRIAEEHLLALVEGLKGGRLEMDFGNVAYLSSRGLGLLVLLHKRLRARGRRLILCNLAPQVFEVFEVTKLHTLLDIRHARRTWLSSPDSPLWRGADSPVKPPAALAVTREGPAGTST